MGSESQPTSGTSISEPWAEQKPYMIEGMKAAQDLWKRSGPDYFPGSTVAGFSPDQVASQDMVRNLTSGAGAQGLNQAINTNTDFLTGKYLNNPYDDQVFNDIQSRVMPAVSGSAMMAGRGGSGQAGSMMTTALTNAYAPYASQNWQAGLQGMQNAIQRAPGLNEAGYFGADALNRSGQQQQQLAQSEIGDQVNRFNHYQNLDYNKLQDYMRNISGVYGGDSTTTTKSGYGPGLLQQLFGAGMAGLGLFGG